VYPAISSIQGLDMTMKASMSWNILFREVFHNIVKSHCLGCKELDVESSPWRLVRGDLYVESCTWRAVRRELYAESSMM
jgi:hypothetical protein